MCLFQEKSKGANEWQGKKIYPWKINASENKSVLHSLKFIVVIFFLLFTNRRKQGKCVRSIQVSSGLNSLVNLEKLDRAVMKMGLMLWETHLLCQFLNLTSKWSLFFKYLTEWFQLWNFPTCELTSTQLSKMRQTHLLPTYFAI